MEYPVRGHHINPSPDETEIYHWKVLEDSDAVEGNPELELVDN